MKTDIIAVMVITTIVAPIISWRVDHDTLPNSCLTSDKNFTVLFMNFIYAFRPLLINLKFTLIITMLKFYLAAFN